MSRRARLLAAQEAGLPAAALCIALAALVARRPAVLTAPEFWAEDGWLWWPDAYAQGLHYLLVPVVGYFQTLSRLTGLAVQPFGLAEAPRLFALVALFIQALPVTFLLSSRLAPVWPSLLGRAAFAALYLALPNGFEEHANLTNAQWHLALLAFLVLVAAPPRRRAGAVFDAAVLLLSGLSGPFCLLLLPIAAWRFAAR